MDRITRKKVLDRDNSRLIGRDQNQSHLLKMRKIAKQGSQDREGIALFVQKQLVIEMTATLRNQEQFKRIISLISLIRRTKECKIETTPILEITTKIK